MKVEIRFRRGEYVGYLWKHCSIISSAYGSREHVETEMRLALEHARNAQKVTHDLNRGRWLWWRR